MARKQVTLKYGPSFNSTLHLNGDPAAPTAATHTLSYLADASALLDAPEQETILANTTYGNPWDVRSKPAERAFTIHVTVQPDITQGQYGAVWHSRVLALKSALGLGAVQIHVDRGGTVMYVTARYEEMVFDGTSGYDIKFVAADPFFTAATGYTIVDASTGSTPNSTDIPIGYAGSAPSMPVFTFEVGGNGRVWRYRKDFFIQNQAPTPLNFHPVCIDLGNIDALCDAGLMTLTTVNGEERPADLRIETFGGARKPIYIRCVRNSASDLQCKVWFTIWHMEPGETKYFRLLYGNSAATIETEEASIRPMFTMYGSGNSQWLYFDFCPSWNQNQSRTAQWVPHTPGRRNLNRIASPNPAFGFVNNDPTTNALVPAAGGFVQYRGRAAGYCGLQLSSSIPIASVVHDVKMSSNFRAPFVLRSQRQDGAWIDSYVQGSTQDVGQRVKLAPGAVHNTGATTLNIDPAYTSNLAALKASFDAGYSTTIRIRLDSGAYVERTISSVTNSNPTYQIVITSGIPSSASTQNILFMFKNYSTRTETYNAGEEPVAIMCGLRVDRPDLDVAETVYAGAEQVTVNFVGTYTPLIRYSTSAGVFNQTSFANGYTFDMNAVGDGYQLNGRAYNFATGKGITVNTVMRNLNDKLELDCELRQCMYYKVKDTTLSATASYPTNTISVVSAAAFAVGDQIYIRLSNSRWHRTVVTNIAGTTITIRDSMPGPGASSGSDVGHWENRFEALYFEEVRDYWVRVEPSQSNSLRFTAGGTSFENISVKIHYYLRYM